MSDIIDKIKVDAAEKAEHAHPGNCIRWEHFPERDAIKLTTIIKNKPLAWIEFPQELFDEFVNEMLLAQDTLHSKK